MDFLIALWHELRARPDFWGFICIPFVAAIVTWAHVWMALQMVFYPLEFVGVAKPWLGWQGIIPRKARKMSGIVVDKTISKLGSVSDFLREMQPEAIARHVTQSVTLHIDEYVDEVMGRKNRVMWENMPLFMRQRVYSHARKHLPDIMDKLVGSLIDNIEQMIDVKEMVCRQMEADKGLMVRMFQEVGHKEFSFIINVSFWIGLSFGFLQMALWYFFPWHFMLPLYAAVLGLATNWLALAMVFRPLNPVKFGPFTFQGVFLRRQAEVADKFAELTATEMMTVGRFMTEVLTGPQAHRAHKLIRRHLTPLVESAVMRTAAQVSIGPAAYAELKTTIAERTAHLALAPLSDPIFNQQRSGLLSKVFAEKIKQLSSAEFQDLLRPAFQEDEWILLVLGFGTGALAGWIQLMTGFA